MKNSDIYIYICIEYCTTIYILNIAPILNKFLEHSKIYDHLFFVIHFFSNALALYYFTLSQKLIRYCISHGQPPIT